jgi:hypothetical protein
VKDFDQKGQWIGSGIYCNNHLSQHYEAAIRFERDSQRLFAKDSYERAIKLCDPKETKRLKLLKEKYQDVLTRL